MICVTLLSLMVLYLVDKNRAWPQFFKAVRIILILGCITVPLGIGALYAYQRHTGVAIKQIDYGALAKEHGGVESQWTPVDESPCAKDH